MGLGAATAAVAGALVEAGVGATAATVMGGALVGAGTGALVGGIGAAATGGKPLDAALKGGLFGAVTGGVGGAIAGPAASTLAASGGADGLTAIGGIGADSSGVLTGAAPEAGAAGTAAFTDAAGNLFDAAGNFLGSGSGVAFTNSAGQAFDAAGNVIPNATGSGGTLSAAAGPAAAAPPSSSLGGSQLAQMAAKVAGGSGGNNNSNEKGGIGGTNLALGALAALGSAFAKPKVGTWTTPGPTSVASSPGFNTPLNTNVPGRTAVNPMPGQPSSSWYTYGQNPEPTYFNNNSTAAYGFARGGALSGEFETGGHRKHVRGPGTGVSDQVPALLSNGEVVLTADDVSRIGNPRNPNAPGANDRGAAIINRDRKALAKLVGQKQFPPKNSRAALNEASITHRGQ